MDHATSVSYSVHTTSQAEYVTGNKCALSLSHSHCGTPPSFYFLGKVCLQQSTRSGHACIPGQSATCTYKYCLQCEALHTYGLHSLIKLCLSKPLAAQRAVVGCLPQTFCHTMMNPSTLYIHCTCRETPGFPGPGSQGASIVCRASCRTHSPPHRTCHNSTLATNAPTAHSKYQNT